MSTGARAVLLSVAVLVTSAAAEAAPLASCDSRLTVQLTPDIPDPRDSGFLGSLLSNEVGYRLVFLGETDDTNIVLELSGPGPAYRCQEAIETLGRDARVMSVHVSQ